MVSPAPLFYCHVKIATSKNVAIISLHARNATHQTTVVLEVVVRAWGDVATVESQVVRAVAIDRRGRPIAPVRTTTDHRRTIHVAGINKIIRIGS